MLFKRLWELQTPKIEFSPPTDNAFINSGWLYASNNICLCRYVHIIKSFFKTICTNNQNKIICRVFEQTIVIIGGKWLIFVLVIKTVGREKLIIYRITTYIEKNRTITMKDRDLSNFLYKRKLSLCLFKHYLQSEWWLHIYAYLNEYQI